MAVVISFPDKDNFYPDELQLIIDASPSREHGQSAKATENTVEQGSNIFDHVVDEPNTLNIEGIISAFPLKEEDLDDTTRVKKALDKLENAKKKHLPLIVQTNLKTYTNMIITDFKFSEKTETGSDSLIFSINFQEILTAITKTGKVPKLAKGKAAPKLSLDDAKKKRKEQQNRHEEKKDKGIKPKKEPNPTTKKKADAVKEPPKSWLYQGIEKTVNWYRGSK